MSIDDVLENATPEQIEAAKAMLEMGMAGDGEQLPPLTQQVEITDAGPCKKHVKVTIDGAVVQARFDEKYSDLMVKTPAQIPGFRPGKAPKGIVKKKFAKELTSEVRTSILMQSLEQLADEELLSPLAPPQLDPNSVIMPEDGSEMIYEFDIEVRPEFDLPEYNGLKIRRPTHTPTQEDIQRETRKLLEPFGKIIPKDGDAPGIALDDIMIADLIIKDGDQEMNHVTGVNLKIEKRLALDDGIAEDFGKTLTGAKVGDTRIVEITLSNEIANESMRGKKLQAVFTVKELKTMQLPELTQEVLANFTVRTKEAFDILVQTRLDRIQEYYQRQTAREQVLQLLAANANWDLPKDLLQRQARKSMQRRVMEMRSSGMTEEQIDRQQRVLSRDVMKTTTAALKEHFVLQKIAEIEKLEIEDADLDAEIEAIADRAGETTRKMRAKLQREDLMEVVATDLLERKALDLVLSSAEYEDYEMNPHAEDDGGAASVHAASGAPTDVAPTTNS